MKALVYTAPNKVEMQEMPEPTAGPGEVILRVGATGICGSDVHGFLGHSPRRQPGLVLGHETCGAVAAVGEGVDASLMKQRVSVNPLISCQQCAACRAGRHNVCENWKLIGMDRLHGGFADLVAVPIRNIRPLPAHVTEAAAVMIEPLANAVHLIAHVPETAGLYPTAAIFGGGTLGMAILTVARQRGIRVVAVSEPNAARARVAEALGAERVIDPRSTNVAEEIRRITGGRGVDVAIEAMGTETIRQEAAASVAKGGTVLLLGLAEGPTTLDFIDLTRREIRLQCSFCYTERDFDAAFEMVARGDVDFSQWTDVLPLGEGQSAFERLITDPGDRIKIALTPF